MGSLARAEWQRLRKRRSLLIIVLAVPVLAGLFFVLGYASLPDVQPFDPVAVRQQFIDQGAVAGMPPEDAEQILVQLVENERANREQQAPQVLLSRERFAFPQSVVTTLGAGTFLLFALILLTATTIGDEFGWGTLRTALLANCRRRGFLIVRLTALLTVGTAILATLAALGVVLPLVLAVAGATLPVRTAVDPAALGLLAVGELVAGAAVIGFAALTTVIARSGSLTLVAVLVYVAVEASILTLLLKFAPFQGQGGLEWLLDVFPIRGVTTLITTLAGAASGIGNYPGEVVNRSVERALVPLVALLAWATTFMAIAVRRFSRMDIVE